MPQAEAAGALGHVTCVHSRLQVLYYYFEGYLEIDMLGSFSIQLE
jgi:hypothetical protein